MKDGILVLYRHSTHYGSACLPLASAVRSVAIWAQQQRHMVVLPLLDTKGDGDLWEKGLVLAKVGARVEAKGPARGPLALAVVEHVEERVDGDLAGRVGGAVGEPDEDAAVVVGDGLERLGLRLRVRVGPGSRCGDGALEADADAAGGAAGLGVEDVAGDGVLCGG